MHRAPVFRSVAVGSALFVLTVGLATQASAQKQLATLKDIENDRGKVFAELGNFRRGEAKPTAADNAKLDAQAKWLVYRFTVQPPIFSDPTKGIQGIQKYQKDFADEIRDIMDVPDSKKKNAEYRRLLAPFLVQRFKDLFNEDFLENRVAIVNCAPMLPLAARIQEEVIGNYLAELVNSKDKHDVIKMYAARGLKEFLPVHTQQPGVLAAADAKRLAREVVYLGALTRFIERPGDDKLPEPQLDALRYLRREAVEALAHAQAPAIIVDKNVDGPIAPTLLRVLAPNSGMTPAPGLPERIEAAIGVCQFNYSNSPGYQPEIGSYLVGKFVGDLAVEYNKDLVDIKADKQPLMAWNLTSKRLEAAFKDLAKNSKGPPADANGKTIADAATKLLKPMQTPAPKYTLIDQNEVLIFSKAVNGMKPRTKEIYKGNSKYEINLD